MTDSATSETVTYQYDSLNRMIAANSTAGWNTVYGFDGWGNLTSKGGSAGVPYLVNAVDPSTNGSPGAAGFPYSPPNYYNSGNYTPPSPYDVEGHMVSDGSGNSFVYDPWGRRIWQETLPTGPENPPTWNTKLTFYAVNGKRIMGFNGLYTTDGSGTPYMVVTVDSQNPYATQQLAGTKQYFGGKLIMSDGNAIGTDRLGSVRSGGNGGAMSYYPYGEERTSTPQGQEKFGTYVRDADGNDYAMARRYSSGSGRFITADPGGARNASVGDPMSWNRMMYVGGDPVNFGDRRGRAKEDCEYDTCVTVNGGADDCDDNPYDASCDGGGEGGSGSPGGDGGGAGVGGGSTSNSNAPTSIKNYSANAKVNATWAAIATAFQNDKSGCADWFAAGFATLDSTMLPTFGSLNNFLMAAEPGLSGAGTFVGGNANAIENSSLIPSGQNIAVNNSGAFFNSGIGVGPADDFASRIQNINGGSAQAQAFILLHELAHVFGMIRSADAGTDAASVANQKYNNDSIWLNCGSLISSFSNNKSN